MTSRIASKSNYLVELVGTFILVYAIASAATTYRDSGTLGLIGIGLALAAASLSVTLEIIGHRIIHLRSNAYKIKIWLLRAHRATFCAAR
jgi:glycerol uptake facilitator-like aquaporin